MDAKLGAISINSPNNTMWGLMIIKKSVVGLPTKHTQQPRFTKTYRFIQVIRPR
jgi:hypothetical protein